MDSEELHLQVLRLLNQNPNLSQRQIARELGLSVGKTNYAVRAVINKGWVKAQNFSNSPNKRRYIYQLTPAGVSEKAQLAYRHLQRKRAEHERLMAEIEDLRAEVEETQGEAEPAERPAGPQS
ncbi:MarR family EPS-associated transcriptional regulator [Halorhodospira halochloris]|uniref:Transcriptional regulator n=1 Tax=Halorhodospira halochloris TaxID=1052 RepID=A0A120MZI0_HALHR|nr:MarR family EPS-associated transcriptional regulator [Halorhodospira halochloris]MBK1652665.1 MarR family EPS-associated transcriptional regulator [Halorhodospira halochloris]MCG5531115.1 MarR family EPS-associated transcriptional regulator [Halorhodospira halochloris]MCG5549471.1 MarR family EPS-associated transcriptional regulator [Halorhodospira halochloris]BAU57102.1 transcriptional regulator [Halorhodospira halochloris]